jgi:hypothetical protein
VIIGNTGISGITKAYERPPEELGGSAAGKWFVDALQVRFCLLLILGLNTSAGEQR